MSSEKSGGGYWVAAGAVAAGVLIGMAAGRWGPRPDAAAEPPPTEERIAEAAARGVREALAEWDAAEADLRRRAELEEQRHAARRRNARAAGEAALADLSDVVDEIVERRRARAADAAIRAAGEAALAEVADVVNDIFEKRIARAADARFVDVDEAWTAPAGDEGADAGGAECPAGWTRATAEAGEPASVMILEPDGEDGVRRALTLPACRLNSPPARAEDTGQKGR